MQAEGVRTYDINDLYERADDGTVRFVDPDTGKEFSRIEAQQWVDMVNNQINSTFRRQVEQEARQTVAQARIITDLYDYAPAYDQMDAPTKEMFDALIEPYGVQDAQGNIIGFDCDLRAMGVQARSLAQRFNASAPKAAEENMPPQTASQPAMDIKAGGSGTGSEGSAPKEPKTLAEAWQMVNKKD